MNKECPICGKHFESLYFSRKYCSFQCRKQAQIDQKEKRDCKNKKNRLCRRCNKSNPPSPFAHYCENCNQKIISEEYENHKLRARKNSMKFYEQNKNKKSYKFKRNQRYKIYHKKRRNSDEQFAIAIRLRNLLYQALKKYTKKGKTFSSSKYGIDFNKIMIHLKPFPKEINKYHIDHIKPISSFNLENPEDIKKAFAPENHQWLLGAENIRKSNKY